MKVRIMQLFVQSGTISDGTSHKFLSAVAPIVGESGKYVSLAIGLENPAALDIIAAVLSDLGAAAGPRGPEMLAEIEKTGVLPDDAAKFFTALSDSKIASANVPVYELAGYTLVPSTEQDGSGTIVQRVDAQGRPCFSLRPEPGATIEFVEWAPRRTAVKLTKSFRDAAKPA